jgi:hypothetical protein
MSDNHEADFVHVGREEDTHILLACALLEGREIAHRIHLKIGDVRFNGWTNDFAHCAFIA